jgi:tRNA 2-thiouridine synthesizing protein A
MSIESSSPSSQPFGEFNEPVAKEVDASGLNCPLPILKAKKALSEIQSGEVLKVVSTDAGSKRDFESFARQTGNTLVHQTAEAHRWSFYLKRR